MSDPSCRLVVCSVPSEACAATLARTLLDERLVACVNIVPGVRSLYRFEGVVEDEGELLLLLKTASDRYLQLEQRIRALHPYKVCEVLAFEVAAGSQAYLDWVLRETRPAEIG